MRVDTETIAARSRNDLMGRNAIFTTFFQQEASRLAEACHALSRRFQSGGRLLAFGSGAAATDAQHVAVEFIHPIIVGKRALPALDLGPGFAAHLPALAGPDDMAMGFSFDGPDAVVERALETARRRGALTFACAGEGADYPFALPDPDPFVCQEVFEVLYHVLWETVHVFFEHREQGHDVGASGFLYPMLGKQEQPLESVVAHVQHSILQKVDEGNRLRTAAAETETMALAQAAGAICERLARGGKIIAFGNGGSATDANDMAVDCLVPPPDLTPIPAISLASDSACITAIANDIGSEAVFARQLIAHARPADVAIGISTSGGSANILAALAEARKRGLLTVGLVGYDGGRIVSERLADHALVVRSDYVPRIQEVQASVWHVLRRRIAEIPAGPSPPGRETPPR